MMPVIAGLCEINDSRMTLSASLVFTMIVLWCSTLSSRKFDLWQRQSRILKIARKRRLGSSVTNRADALGRLILKR